jgi:hypothetical protein
MHTANKGLIGFFDQNEKKILPHSSAAPRESQISGRCLQQFYDNFAQTFTNVGRPRKSHSNTPLTDLPGRTLYRKADWKSITNGDNPD